MTHSEGVSRFLCCSCMNIGVAFVEMELMFKNRGRF